MKRVCYVYSDVNYLILEPVMLTAHIVYQTTADVYFLSDRTSSTYNGTKQN